MGGAVATVGCGPVGRAWAIVFARAGHDVRLWDERPDASAAARDVAVGILPELERLGLIACGPDAAPARIRVTPELAEALDGAVHVRRLMALVRHKREAARDIGD